MRIEKDTTVRGTVDNPVYLVFLRYGERPEFEQWLKAKTDADAIKEVDELFLMGHKAYIVAT